MPKHNWVETPYAGEKQRGTLDRMPAPAPRILLVEDHQPTASVIAQQLAARGYTVKVAHTFREAIAISSSFGFDVLLADIGLPEGNGWELLKSLRLERPNLRAVAVSGFATDVDRMRSEQAGFHAHLAKPVCFEELVRTINSICGVSAVEPVDAVR